MSEEPFCVYQPQAKGLKKENEIHGRSRAVNDTFLRRDVGKERQPFPYWEMLICS